MNWFKENNGKLTLNIYVIPRSSRTEIIGIYASSLKIKLKAPPVDNAANEELIKFIASNLAVSKSSVEIVKGHNQKRKVLSIIGTNEEKVKRLINKAS